MAGMSLQDCQLLMAAEVGRYKGPIVFHSTDCAAAVISAYHALGLADIGPAEWTKGHALFLLRESGGLAEAVSELLQPFGWVSIEVDAPEIFDLGLCRLDVAESLAIFNGVAWMARGPEGPLLMDQAIEAWRPPADRLQGLIDGG